MWREWDKGKGQIKISLAMHAMQATGIILLPSISDCFIFHAEYQKYHRNGGITTWKTSLSRSSHHMMNDFCRGFSRGLVWKFEFIILQSRVDQVAVTRTKCFWLSCSVAQGTWHMVDSSTGGVRLDTLLLMRVDKNKSQTVNSCVIDYFFLCKKLNSRHINWLWVRSCRLIIQRTLENLWSNVKSSKTKTIKVEPKPTAWSGEHKDWLLLGSWMLVRYSPHNGLQHFKELLIFNHFGSLDSIRPQSSNWNPGSRNPSSVMCWKWRKTGPSSNLSSYCTYRYSTIDVSCTYPVP